MNVIRQALAALRLPRRSLRLQLALLYGGAFVACGPARRSSPCGLARAQRSPERRRQHRRRIPSAVASTSVPRLVSWPWCSSLALGWLIAGRLLRPLRMITATARDISATNLTGAAHPAPTTSSPARRDAQ